MTTVLLTGFDPFDGAERNASADAVAIVAREWQAGMGTVTLVTATLPVEFDRAGEALRQLIAEHSPDLVIATGVAAGRTAITPERVAVNLRDARIPDNAGAQPVDAEVEPGGEAARFSRLPVKQMVAAIEGEGIRAEVSLSAGSYVCNSLMYELLGSTSVAAGFIHVPSEDAMPVEMTARGLAAALHVALNHD